MAISDVLTEIAEKLRNARKLTALDLYRLHAAAQALAESLGYQNESDPEIFSDAAAELQQKTQEKGKQD